MASQQTSQSLVKGRIQLQTIEASSKVVQKPKEQTIIASKQFSQPRSTISPRITSSVQNTFEFFKQQSSELYEMLYQAEKQVNEPRMKQFLKTVKGACRSLNNTISGNSLKLLVYQKERILSLFQGKTVTISDIVIEPLTVQNGPNLIKVLLGQYIF